jgi:hypothetical protein
VITLAPPEPLSDEDLAKVLLAYDDSGQLTEDTIVYALKRMKCGDRS